MSAAGDFMFESPARQRAPPSPRSINDLRAEIDDAVQRIFGDETELHQARTNLRNILKNEEGKAVDLACTKPAWEPEGDESPGSQRETDSDSSRAVSICEDPRRSDNYQPSPQRDLNVSREPRLDGELVLLQRDYDELAAAHRQAIHAINEAASRIEDLESSLEEVQTLRGVEARDADLQILQLKSSLRKFEAKADLTELFQAYESEIRGLQIEVHRLKDENLQLSLGDAPMPVRIKELQEELQETRMKNAELQRKERNYAVGQRCMSDLSRKLQVSQRECEERTRELKEVRRQYEESEEFMNRMINEQRRCNNELELSRRAVSGMSEEICVLKEACLITSQWKRKDGILTKFLALDTRKELERQRRTKDMYGRLVRSLASAPSLMPLATRVQQEVDKTFAAYIELDHHCDQLYGLVTEAAQREIRHPQLAVPRETSASHYSERLQRC